MGNGVVQGVTALLSLIGGVVLLLFIDRALTLVSLVSTVPTMWLLRTFIGRVGPPFGNVQRALRQLNSLLQEDLWGWGVHARTLRDGRLECFGLTAAEREAVV